MSSSAPRCRLAIVRTEPPPLVAAIRQLYAGRSPLHPPPLQKADVASPSKERERNQAPILGGGDLPANTTAWGLDGVTRITLLSQGAGCEPALALAASVKVFMVQGLFSKSRPAGEPSADGGAKPHSLSPLQGQVSISQKWYNLLHHFEMVFTAPLEGCIIALKMM